MSLRLLLCIRGLAGNGPWEGDHHLSTVRSSSMAFSGSPSFITLLWAWLSSVVASPKDGALIDSVVCYVYSVMLLTMQLLAADEAPITCM